MDLEKLKNGALKALYVLYPIAILFIVIVFFPRWVHAGIIRKLVLTPDKPGIVNLAFGNATAISFQTKPEKLVAGSPTKVQIDFLGKDLTVTPVLPNPGNLLIYTGAGRYVILFRIVSESQYDDVVEINSGTKFGTRPLKLDRDSFHLETVSAEFKGRTKNKKRDDAKFQVLISAERLEGEEFSSFLSSIRKIRCDRCALKRDDGNLGLICAIPVPFQIHCQSEEFRQIKLVRGAL